MEHLNWLFSNSQYLDPIENFTHFAALISAAINLTGIGTFVFLVGQRDA